MKFLSKKQVRDLVGLSHTQVGRLEAAGKFPVRVRIGFRVFWIDEEVLDWMRERIDKRIPPRTEADTEYDNIDAEAA